MSNQPRNAAAAAEEAADADVDPDSVDHNSNYDEASDYDNDGNGSVCSYLSGNGAVSNTWRGWRCAQTSSCNAAALQHQHHMMITGAVDSAVNGAGGDGVSYLRRYHMHQAAAAVRPVMTLNNMLSSSRVLPLKELAARSVASYLPFEMVDQYNLKKAPVPEELQRKIAFWSFPENEEDVRLYSTLANGSPEQYLLGEGIAKTPGTVKNMIQIGFHLTAVVQAPVASSSSAPASVIVLPRQYDVCMTFDRKRITTCSCTCSVQWCEHIVAVCLARVRYADKLTLRAPISESLYRLDRTQLHKAFQYFVNELPRHVLPHAQRVLDELLTPQSIMNRTHGAPDPTAGSSASDVSSWWYELSKLRSTVKALLYKFCTPSPTVYSDVGYLSASQSTAAAEWSSLMRPLRGREPEGLWNLLGIVREMLRRGDNNAASLLRAITDECLQHSQVPIWWFNIRTSHYYGGSGSSTRAVGGGASNSNPSGATQHACASLMDEIASIWRIVALNPTFTDKERLEVLQELCNSHDKIFELIINARQQQQPHNVSNDALSGVLKPVDIAVFTGFRAAVEAALLDWHGYSLYDNKLMYLSVPLTVNNSDAVKRGSTSAAQIVRRKQHAISDRSAKSRLNNEKRAANTSRFERKKRTGKCRIDDVDAARRRRNLACGTVVDLVRFSVDEAVKERSSTNATIAVDAGQLDTVKKPVDFEDVHTEVSEIGDRMKLPKNHVCQRLHSSKRRGGQPRSSLRLGVGSIEQRIVRGKNEDEDATETNSTAEPSVDVVSQHELMRGALGVLTLKSTESDTDIDSKKELPVEPVSNTVELVDNEQPHTAREKISSRKERGRDRTLYFTEKRRRHKAALAAETAKDAATVRADVSNGNKDTFPALSVPFLFSTTKPSTGLSTGALNDGQLEDDNEEHPVPKDDDDESSALPTVSKSKRKSSAKCSKTIKPTSLVSINGTRKLLADEKALDMVKNAKFLPNIRKPVDRLEVLFMRAEALYGHGFAQASLHLSVQLAQQMLKELDSGATAAVPTSRISYAGASTPSTHAEEMLRLTAATADGSVNVAGASSPATLGSSSNLQAELEQNTQPNHAGESKTTAALGANFRTKSKSFKMKSLLSSVSHSAYSVMSKIVFLLQVLADEPAHHYDALLVGLQGLMLARPAAASRALEVRLSSQEQDILQLMKQQLTDTPTNERMRDELRKLADQMRKGELKSRGPALLPCSLANYLFDQLCLQSKSSSADDETLGFEAALAALGQKAAISESEYPLVCEGTRRQRGELALLMFWHYRDDERQLARILDRFLDRDIYSIFRCDQPLGYSSAVGEVRIDEHMMSTFYRTPRRPANITSVLEKLFAFHAHTMLPAGMFWHMPLLYESISTGGGLYTMQETVAGGNGANAGSSQAKRSPFLRQNSLPFPDSSYGAAAQPSQQFQQTNSMLGGPSNRNVMPQCDAFGNSYILCSADAVGNDVSSSAPNHRPIIFVMPPCRSPYVDYFCSLNCGGMPIDVVLGMSHQQQYPPSRSAGMPQQHYQQEQVQNRPVLQHSLSTSGFQPHPSNSLGSSSNAPSSVVASAAPSPLPQHMISHQQHNANVFSGRKGSKPKPFALPNQPSDALAYFMFEFAKTLLAKAGGSTITSIFHVAPNHNNGVHPRAGQNGIHRGLQMCAFQVAMYALGVNNRVTPNWLQRTYFSNIHWLQTQAIDIGTAAINFLTQTWEGHLTPSEAAQTADQAARSADREVLRAAAYLAQSTLVHAAKIVRTEMQRALELCEEQSHEMLEESLLCIEASARAAHINSGSGVSAEALFDVARRWCKLYRDGKRGYATESSIRNGRGLSRRVAAANPAAGYREQQPNPHYQPHPAAARVDDDDGQYGSGDDDDNYHNDSIDGDSDAENENNPARQDFVFSHIGLKSLYYRTSHDLNEKRRRRRQTTLARERNSNNNNFNPAYNAWHNMGRFTANASSRTGGGGERAPSPMPINFALQLGLQASSPTEAYQQLASDQNALNEYGDPTKEQLSGQMAVVGGHPSAAVTSHAASFFHPHQQQQQFATSTLPYGANASLPVLQPSFMPMPAVSHIAIMPAFGSSGTSYQQQMLPAHVGGPPLAYQQQHYLQQQPNVAPVPLLSPLDTRFLSSPPTHQPTAQAFGMLPANVYGSSSPRMHADINALNLATQRMLAESVVAAHQRFQAAMVNMRAVMAQPAISQPYLIRAAPALASPHSSLQYQQQQPYDASSGAGTLPSGMFVPPQQQQQPMSPQQQHQAFIASLAANNNNNFAARFAPPPLPSPSELLGPLNSQLIRYPVPPQQLQQPVMLSSVSANAANQQLQHVPPPPLMNYFMLNSNALGVARAPYFLQPQMPVPPSAAPPTNPPTAPTTSNNNNNPNSITPRYFTGQDKHLLAAYRVGMVAMETLTSRVFEDRVHLKYHKARSPFSAEVQWLLEKVVQKLGVQFFPYFIAGVMAAVSSPFVLFRIAYESALFLAATEVAASPNNNNNIHFDAALLVRKQFHSTILGQLMCKCMQMFQQCLLQKIHHITPNDYDEFVDTVQWAQMIYYIMPAGHAQFELLLKVIHGDPSCKGELWDKIMASVAQFHAELTPPASAEQLQQQQFNNNSAVPGAAGSGVVGQRFHNRFINSSTGASAGSSADM